MIDVSSEKTKSSSTNHNKKNSKTKTNATKQQKQSGKEKNKFSSF